MASKIAISLEACHAIDLLKEAFHRYGALEIVNTDQGIQYTAIEFVTTVKGRERLQAGHGWARSLA
jgi:putative transposase